MVVLKLLLYALGGIGLAVIGFLIRDVFRKMSGSALILGIGLVGFFIGERILGDSDWRLMVTALSGVILLGSVGLRAFAMSRSEGGRRTAHTRALVFTCVAVGSLALYALTQETVTASMGEELAERWSSTLTGIWPIGVIIGVIPTFLLDRALATHPVLLPAGAARRAVLSGTATALAIALIFPINYLAEQHSAEWDFAYFRTARPGDSTRSLVKTLPEPAKAILFYAPGSEVKEKMLPYFTELADASGGTFTVEVVDQPLAPQLAEDLKIRDNGYVAFTMGEAKETFKISTEMRKAKRDLKKLDETVQKHLLKLAKGDRTVYVLTGHGEASAREREDLLRKTNLFKQSLQSQNFTVKNFGVADGSAQAVPDDAAMVLILSPEEPLLPEEEDVLKEYLDGGGRLMALLDPDRERLDGLLAHLGARMEGSPLANKTKFFRTRGANGPQDQMNLVTNRFGSHPSVHTVSRNSQQMALLMVRAGPLVKQDQAPGKITTVIRSMPDTYMDVDGNLAVSEGEQEKVWDIGLAFEGPEDRPYRALVVGDVSVLADPLVSVSAGNQAFALDSVKWLAGDEDFAGEIESEEDVKIQHTNEDDKLFFYMTVLGMPLFILALGAIVRRTT